MSSLRVKDSDSLLKKIAEDDEGTPAFLQGGLPE